MVLSAVGGYAYQRKDGVFVVPIGCLKDLFRKSFFFPNICKSATLRDNSHVISGLKCGRYFLLSATFCHIFSSCTVVFHGTNK